MSKQLTREVGTPVEVEIANAEGTALDLARRDHVHQGTVMVTGTYQGDGAATLGVAGVGFQGRYIIIWKQAVTNQGIGWKSDQDGLNASVMDLAGPSQRYRTDMIISFDPDGFTVGDGTGLANIFNVNLMDYTYVIFK